MEKFGGEGYDETESGQVNAKAATIAASTHGEVDLPKSDAD